MNTYRVFAALLSYPEEATEASLEEMKAILEDEGLVAPEDRERLGPLFADLAQMDIYDLQARYVELFDQSRSLSLHLFEHVHGESRDRGQAMVDLLERYRGHGLELSAAELPDFLPVFLEYLSQLPAEDAVAALGEARAVISTLARRLGTRESPYAAVLEALAHLVVQASAPDESPEDDSPAAVDAEWQEEPVDFSRREKSFVGRQRARSFGATHHKGKP